jgi:SAM-dependent methyltransferase
MTASKRWAASLSQWAIPPEILESVPDSPWGFPREIFARGDGAAPDTPSTRRALEALTDGAPGVILDVGAGGGRASLPLCPPGLAVLAVDSSTDLLAAFDEAATRRGVEHRAISGRWPDVAETTPVADVVLCHHVLYNVPDLAAFARALTEHARRRVVVEITTVHPQTALNGLWLRFHGLVRPDGPGLADVLPVVKEAGSEPEFEIFTRPSLTHGHSREQLVAMTRRRLCLPPDRDAELNAALGEHPRLFTDEAACIWWEGGAR